MAVVQALKRGSAKSNPQQIPETDSVDIATIVRASGGVGSLYADTSTTSVVLGTGSAVTTVTVGGGTGYTGGTYGKSGQTETFLGNLTTNGNATVTGTLTVAGTTTTVNSTTVTTQDKLFTLAFTSPSAASSSAAIAVFRGTSGTDQTLIWNDTNTRWELGAGTTSGGTTVPTVPLTAATLSTLRLGAVLLDGGSPNTITATGALTVTGAGTVTVSATGSNNVAITSGAATTITSTTSTSITATTSISLSSTTSTTIAATTTASLTAGASSDLTLGARGQNYTFNDASNVSLNAGFVSVTSIIGALNYLLTNNSPTTTYTNNNAGTITQGQAVYITAQDKVDLANPAADNNLCNFIGVVQPSAGIATTASGLIQTSGVALLRFKIGRHVPATGDEIFLDSNAGYFFSAAQDASALPTTAGTVWKSVGFAKNLNGNTAAASISGTDALVYCQLVQGSKTTL